jgi:hypothetical protein
MHQMMFFHIFFTSAHQNHQKTHQFNVFSCEKQFENQVLMQKQTLTV